MNNKAEIFLWGTRIGMIYQPEERNYSTFEYDDEFKKSGIEIAPVMMPIKGKLYEFPLLSGAPFYGMPGLVADSLPDKFGNTIIEDWLSSHGKTLSDFSAIDRLCYTGKRGMGALEFVPAIQNENDIDEEINVKEMVEFASEILGKRESKTLDAEDNLTYSQLIQVGTSAGGARAKALIAWNEKTNEIKSGQLDLDKDFDYWLMKFDNVQGNGDYGLNDEPEYTLIEYAYYKMALDCGINMNECRIYNSDGMNHFMTKRFDRKNGKKIHMQSLAALTHTSYKEPCVLSYELAAQYMKIIGLGYKDIEQLYRRMVFNCLAVNQDDHVKNISFLMDKAGKWHLSPAYDVTFAYNPSNRWLSAHQMTINGKNKNITLEDIISAGEKMEIKKSHCLEIVNNIQNVVNHFVSYAENIGIKEITAEEIQQVILSQHVRI